LWVGGSSHFLPIELLADLCHTLGWRACLSPVHRTISLGRLFSFRLAGYAFNTLTPTAAIGGELSGNSGCRRSCRSEATAGVMVDKLTHTVAQILLVSLGSLVVVWGMELSSGVWVVLAAASLLLVLGSVVFLILQMRARWAVYFVGCRQEKSRQPSGPGFRPHAHGG